MNLNNFETKFYTNNYTKDDIRELLNYTFKLKQIVKSIKEQYEIDFVKSELNELEPRDNDMVIMCLDKNDLISLVKGTLPNFSIINNNLIKEHGNYYGSWKWNYNAFKNCNEEEIIKIYYLCKNSWD